MPSPPAVTDADKQALWQAYREGKADRAPVMFYTNPRVVIDHPQWNPEGITFEQCYHDPKLHLEMLLRHDLYRRQVIHRHSDGPTELPAVWEVSQFEYNVYEAAQLGAPIRFPAAQVPVTEPPFEDDDDKLAVFEQDITRPLESPYWSSRLAFWRELDKVAQATTFHGRPVRLMPMVYAGTDGPLTVACNLRGTAFLMDLIEDPDYADRLMRFISDAAIHRRQAFIDLWGDRIARPGPGLADDSCAMLSVDMYRQQVMPHHRRLYDAMGEGTRGMHLCGNATHLFPTLAQELGVGTFDTGFPVNHGRLREQLGPDIEILGGPEADLLLHSSPDEVRRRARDILTSGINRSGRFILREGNNLPPLVPEENLAAMYDAALTTPRAA